MKFYGCKFFDYKICLIKDTSIVLWHNDGIDNLRREFVKRQIFLPLCSYFYQNIMISAEKTLSLYPVLCNNV